jgi:hypothetical protein
MVIDEEMPLEIVDEVGDIEARDSSVSASRVCRATTIPADLHDSHLAMAIRHIMIWTTADPQHNL